MAEIARITLAFNGTELVAAPEFSTRWPRLFGPVAVRGKQVSIPCGGLHDITPFELEALLYNCVSQMGEAWHMQQQLTTREDAEGLFS
jgi:hypothetical protein